MQASGNFTVSQPSTHPAGARPKEEPVLGGKSRKGETAPNPFERQEEIIHTTTAAICGSLPASTLSIQTLLLRAYVGPNTIRPAISPVSERHLTEEARCGIRATFC